MPRNPALSLPVYSYSDQTKNQEISQYNPGAILENLHDIIVACARNQNASQKLVYEQYYGFALKIVFRYIYRYDRAVDVVNDGFVKLFRHIHRFILEPGDEHLEQRFMGWMRRIMINAAIDQLRSNSMTPEIGGIPEDIWETPDRSLSPDQALLYKELVCLVKELPPSYRTVFNLIVIDGLGHQEVANLLGISVGTSKSNLSRARTILQKRLKDLEAIYYAVYR
ncbi:MAG: sigma-70 family RNA polymerase sigma factor [Candidatus Pseudobacter hemicellulosilyticus]|uniref:Sigma-70 family RNA polymerase sigma factor n=1 Tax=Candidatus Pseudobacter hemicellulosilyticus TaxID=3121375 RepID=A0AAJ5WU00_9BACT|nr:MAG: sigma-70 family RNA polymerase sigma factor [Pseudobacter sp.]